VKPQLPLKLLPLKPLLLLPLLPLQTKSTLSL